MNIVFLGPQSSGKGTQAALLSKELHIPAMTLGNILRKKQKEANDEGKMIASLLSQGELLPDELVDEIVREELRSERYSNGVILDGYPRNSHQAEELEKYLSVDRVIFLDVPDGIVMQRMLARRVCDECGENYSLISKPPKKENVCDGCGGILVSRQDDTKEAIAKRLNIYHEKTKPLIDHYQGIGKLIYIDGTGNIEAVRGEIAKRVT